MREPDVWGTTRKLIELYGAGAQQTALYRAEMLMSRGDSRGSLRWQEILTAVRRLQDRTAAPN
jgi:hypothetical protein